MELLPRLGRRRIGHVTAAVAFTTAIVFLGITYYHDSTRSHHLSPAFIAHTSTATIDAAGQVVLPSSEAGSVCRELGFPVHKPRGRKIYDLVLLSTELD